MPESIEPEPLQPNVTKTAYNPVSGQILYVTTGSNGTVIFETTPDMDWIDGEWSGQTHYVADGGAALRPATGLPPSHELVASADWSVDDVPEGTVVLINGEEAGTVDDTGLTLSFALAGVWRVDLRPPFPWIEASCEVTVS